MTPDPFDPFDALVAETPPEVLTAGQKWVQKQFYDELKQTSGELCEACGWRFVVPGRGCLNCKEG